MDNVMFLKKIVKEDIRKRESCIPDYLLKFQPLEKDKDEYHIKFTIEDRIEKFEA